MGMKSSLELAAQEHIEKCQYDKESSELRRHVALCFIAGARHREAELMGVIKELRGLVLSQPRYEENNEGEIWERSSYKRAIDELVKIDKQLKELGIE